MGSKSDELFQELFQTYKLRFYEKTASVCQKECCVLWKEHKSNVNVVREMIDRWKLEINQRKSSNSIKMFFKAPSSSRNSPAMLDEDEPLMIDTVQAESGEPNIVQPTPPSSADLPSVSANSSSVSATTAKPVQEKLLEEISEVSKKIAALAQLKIIRNFWSPEETLLNKKFVEEKKVLEKKLKRNRIWASASQATRNKRKVLMDKLLSEHPDSLGPTIRKTFRGRVGRPRIEVEQQGLQEAIIELVIGQASADGRRQTEGLTICATLDQLNELLEERGFTISRTATYYRLLPARSNSVSARRHVNPLPIRLKKPENDIRKKHVDSQFAMGTVKMLKELAVFFGDKCVFYLSQDDKARIPIGLPAANKQSALVMHMEYRVSLPDHNWVVAERHKLIPSVYACCIVEEKKVSYSGPTYISIRSGKHDSSTAQSHSDDFVNLSKTEQFAHHMNTPAGLMKPIVIVNVDGGPDENPRYPKTCSSWSKHFQEYDLDILCVATHAPGQSAFNAVERRMAPLSLSLAGVLLPHDYYGTHLDSRGKTNDIELEKKNFEKAGDTLAEIFSQTVINEHPVISKYVKPNPDLPCPDPPSESWLQRHVRQSQYLLQIVKCNDRECCNEWRTNYNLLFPNRFLPSPILTNKNGQGVCPVSKESQEEGRFIGLFTQLSLRVYEKILCPELDKFPFDYYCPSVSNKVRLQICKHCHLYFPTQVAMKRHHKSKVCYNLPAQISLSVEGEEESNIALEEDREVEHTNEISGETLVN